MLYILIIAFGFLEFLIGCYISFFAKSKWVKNCIYFIYNGQKDITKDKVKEIKMFIGQSFSLEGSFYAFFAALCRNYELGYFILMIFLILIEIYSYKIMKKQIIEILKN